MKTSPNIELNKVESTTALALLILLLLIGISFAAALMASTALSAKASLIALMGACFVSACLTCGAFVCVSLLISSKK